MGDITKNIDAFEALAVPMLSLKSLPPVVDFFKMYSPALEFTPLFPRQETLLKLIFLDTEHMDEYDRIIINKWREESGEPGGVKIPYDVWDRVAYLKKNNYRHFKEVILCLGRRASKGFLTGHVAAYKTAQLLATGNPQRFYGVQEGKDIYLQVLATTYSQAKDNVYMDIANTILGCQWFDQFTSSVSETSIRLETFFDKSRNEREIQRMKEAGSRLHFKKNASIHIQPFAAKPMSLRGYADFMIVFDEFAYGLADGTQASAAELYHAATPALQQFGSRNTLVMVPSTPVSQTGKFYDLFEDSFKMQDDGLSAKNPQMLCLQAPSWELFKDYERFPAIKKPVVVDPAQDPEFAREEERNPEKFAVEYRAQFQNVEDAFLNADKVDEIFKAYPSVKDNRNVPQKTSRIDRTYVVHCDAGRTNDNFCLVAGHKEKMDDGLWHAFTDIQKMWQPSDFDKNDKGVYFINYLEVMSYIVKLLREFYVERLTFDQWQSAYFIDFLNAERLKGEFLNNSVAIEEDTYHARKNYARWERYKQAIYQGWVHAPYIPKKVAGVDKKISVLSTELKFLTLVNGNKVEHPTTGFWPHNDLADAHSNVVVNLLKNQLIADDEGSLSGVTGAAQGGYLAEETQYRQFEIAQQNSERFEQEMGIIGDPGGISGLDW